MSDIIKPGQGLIYMKIGNHARETLKDIIERKTREIEETGFGFWGYGGSTCHPRKVQPFAKDFERRGSAIYLCMEPMESKHFAEPVRADEFSVDGVKWQEIPSTINVVGSRYALVIRGLREDSFDLPLERTKVAVGNSMGAQGSKYVSGRVDKACLTIADLDPTAPEKTVHIGFVADIVEPYAVLLRNRRH